MFGQQRIEIKGRSTVDQIITRRRTSIQSKINRVYKFSAIIVCIIIGFLVSYHYGYDHKKKELKEQSILDEKENNKVYLDILDVIHADKSCIRLSSVYGDSEISVGVKGVKFIDKKFVDNELLDTVLMCTRCMFDHEYDKLHNGYYQKVLFAGSGEK